MASGESERLAPAVPQEGPGVRAMEVRPDGDPVRCLKCGGAKDGSRAFVCRTCYPTINDLYTEGAEREWRPLGEAWRAGARDFPRPAPSITPVAPTGRGLPPGPAGHVCVLQCWKAGKHLLDSPLTPVAPTGWEPGMPNLPKPPLGPSPAYGRLVGEMLSPEGVPLSALQGVVAKRTEPAPKQEPWRSSVDEDHWIPDAPRGTAGTRGSR